MVPPRGRRSQTGVSETQDAPIWAGPDIYPEKPVGVEFGSLSRKGRRSEFDSLEALCAHVRSSRHSVEAVWTPDTGRMVPPEAVPDLLEPLRRRFLDNAEGDQGDAKRNAIIFGALLVWALYAALANRVAPLESPTVGLSAVLLIMMGLIPWYDARKARREAWELSEEHLRSEEEDARFDYWLARQRGRVTVGLLVLLAVAGAVQIWVGVESSIEAAGLDKAKYRAGEWWRLFTAPFLHGHALHWALNAAGLWYVARRVEALARWPHVVLVFLMAMMAGGIATAEMMPDRPSVGASGGLLGLLGFLLVFETLHPRLVPHPTRRRLFAGLGVIFLIGFVGYQFIDNYAHGGGLAAGVVYGAIVFPKSRSPRRPRPNTLDVVVGTGAAAVLTASLLLAVGRMLAS